MVNFTGEIPAAKSYMCGNYLDHNLEITKIECCKFFRRSTISNKKRKFRVS